MKHPFFKSSNTAFAVGAAFFLAGWWCWYDAFDGRGKDQPKVIRPFTWW